jgi:hypothetical protein
MFSNDFFPTPENVIETMLAGEDITGKNILEPSAGKGNIVDFCAGAGALIIACENNPDLKKILQTKCKVIAEDFLTVSSDQISHIDYIVMNPPFSADEKHILHAYNIAPNGCKIIALCNASTIENTYTQARKELKSLVDNYGSSQNLGECFTTAERQTNVSIALVKLKKPGENYNAEFEGFFLEDDPEEAQHTGLMPYNVVRDLVNRYVAAIKLYDEQLATGAKMNSLLNGFYGESLTFTCTEKGAPKLRNEFKKDLQKAGWKFIFSKMNMEKYATRGLKEDINKFVEQQTQIPFTMRNIYKMLEIVIGTQSQRMDRAIVEVFERISKHHDGNTYGLPGWKTNSHFLLTKRFIFPYIGSVDACRYGKKWPNKDYSIYNSDCETISDLEKALCYITGENYDEIKSIWNAATNCIHGEWYECHFFKFKGFKKGTLHVEFKNEDTWGKFNQNLSRIKGYPLFEGKEQTRYQDRQTGRAQQEKANPAHAYKPTVLFEIKIAS